MSPVNNFTTPLVSGDKTPFNFLVYGDMGTSSNALLTAKYSRHEINDRDVKFVFHIGDISYARGYVRNLFLSVIFVEMGQNPPPIGKQWQNSRLSDIPFCWNVLWRDRFDFFSSFTGVPLGPMVWSNPTLCIPHPIYGGNRKPRIWPYRWSWKRPFKTTQFPPWMVWCLPWFSRRVCSSYGQPISYARKWIGSILVKAHLKDLLLALKLT